MERGLKALDIQVTFVPLLSSTEIKILCSEKVGDRKFKGSCFASKNDKGDEMGNTEDLVVFRKLKKSSNQSA